MMKSLLLGTALAATVSLSSAVAAERFATLGDVPATKLTVAQAAEIRGADHMVRFVQRIGVEIVDPAFTGLLSPGSSKGPAIGKAKNLDVINGLFN